MNWRFRGTRATFMLAVILLAGGCGEATATYQAPFVPVAFSIDTSGHISVHAVASVVTELGEFSVSGGVGHDLRPQEAGTVRLTIRHVVDGAVMDTLYDIVASRQVKVMVDGHVEVSIAGREVTVDASRGTSCVAVVDVRSNDPKDAHCPGPAAASNPPAPATSAPAASTPPPSQTPRPTPVSTPTRPTLPYHADWSAGTGGWTVSSDWKAAGGMLVADGSSYSVQVGAVAPLDMTAVPDYAVDVDLQLVSRADDGNFSQRDSFGVVVRSIGGGGGYGAGSCIAGGLFACTSSPASQPEYSAVVWSTRDTSPVIAHAQFQPGSGWHHYRVVVRATTITLSVDGQVSLTANDNRFLQGGRVGLWSMGCQVDAKNFAVSAA